MLIGLGAIMAVAAGLLAVCAFIRRPVRRLLVAARTWRAGELGTRTGLSGRDEFGQLGEALDAMAASLQRHQGELREAAFPRMARERRPAGQGIGQARVRHAPDHGWGQP